jgi:NADH:ubiquinone oxidoreductase subunit F (NADH-binding)
VRQLELLKARSADEATIAELGQAMRDASICGLGQTAASAIESAFANVLKRRSHES